jgi:molybdopterin synthase sulfur carrier subunit
VTAPIRIEIPAGLSLLAGTSRDLTLPVEFPVTQRTILDALERAYPMLRGTIRDQTTKKRRPFIRFFACQTDFSHNAADAPLPQQIADGTERFYIVGAIAGG